MHPSADIRHPVLIDLCTDRVFIRLCSPVGSPYVFNERLCRYPPLSSLCSGAINTLSGDTMPLLENYWNLPLAVLLLFPRGLDEHWPHDPDWSRISPRKMRTKGWTVRLVGQMNTREVCQSCVKLTWKMFGGYLKESLGFHLHIWVYESSLNGIKYIKSAQEKENCIQNIHSSNYIYWSHIYK